MREKDAATADHRTLGEHRRQRGEWPSISSVGSEWERDPPTRSKKAREPLTNFFAWLQRGKGSLLRLATPVWSKADEVAAELEELTKSQVWVDEAEKGAPIQQVRELIMSLTHLHHADFDGFGRNSPSCGLCDS